MSQLSEPSVRRLVSPALAVKPSPENPFASRYVRPGALPFVSSESFDVSQLADRLVAVGGCGAVVGPHGSGKSTLLTHLGQAMRERGYRVQIVVAGNATAANLSPLIADSGSRRMLFLDGYDLLPAWKRWWILRRCRQAGIGLVVTSHWPLRLPALAMTSTSLEVASRLTALLAGSEFAAECETTLHESFARHEGNLREVWFDLYDRYERTVRTHTGPPHEDGLRCRTDGAADMHLSAPAE